MISTNNNEFELLSHTGPSGSEIESANISISEKTSIIDSIELSYIFIFLLISDFEQLSEMIAKRIYFIM